MKKFLLFTQVLLAIALLSGCGDSKDEELVKITAIKIINTDDEGIISIEKGTSVEVKTDVTPGNADKSLVYESGYTNVFAVDANGKVTALADGEAILTVKAQDDLNIFTTCKISVYTVPVPTEALIFTDAVDGKIDVLMDQTKKVNIGFEPIGVTNKKLSYESSNNNIFTVDGKGNIKGIVVGEAILTVKSLDGSGVTATCIIKVNEVLVGNIRVENSSMTVGSTLDISSFYTIKPDNATSKVVSYSSETPSLATVDQNGVVTALAKGEVNIIVKAEDGSGVIGKSKIKIGTKYTALDRTNYTVNKSSETKSDGGGCYMILNDDYGKYWHSQWDGGNAPLPHWLLVKLDQKQTISRIDIARRKSDGKVSTDTKHVVIEASADNVTYFKLGSIDFGKTNDLERSIQFYPTAVRFIKITIDESNRSPFANMSRFCPYVIE